MGKGKLKALFKKKEGGSALGNAFRFVGDKFTGGLVSSLFPKPTDNDLKKDDAVVTTFNAQPSTEDQEAAAAAAEQKKKNQKIMKWIGFGLAAAVALAVVLRMIFKKKKR